MMKFLKSTIVTGVLLWLEHGMLVKGQNVHTVNVGVQGSFFDPQITSAQVNDTVTFVFLGDIHTVTESSFETPCVALPGGFNSGVAGVGANLSNLTPVESWTLTITNASAPIYFFCEISRPQSHCNSGMVGAINALPDDYHAYLTAAQQATGTPKPSVGVALTGVEAFATAAPSATGAVTSPGTATSPVSSPSSPLTNTPSPTPSSPNATVPPPAPSNKLPSIVGGAVGGVVALFLVLFGVMMYRHRTSNLKRRRRYVDSLDRGGEKRNNGMDSLRFASSPASDQVLFNKTGVEDLSWADHRIAEYRSDGHGAGVQRNGSRSDDDTRGGRDNRQNYERNTAAEPNRLVPVRAGQTPPPHPPPPTQVPVSPTTPSTRNRHTTPDSSFGAQSRAINHQRSFNSTSEDGSQGGADSQLVQALAQQVVALLHTSPGITTGTVAGAASAPRALPMVVQNRSGTTGDLEEDMRYTLSADGHPPPTYRARQSPAAHPSVLNAQNLHYGDNKF